MFGALFTYLADSDAERYGRIGGVVTGFVLLGAGIAKCYAISQRRHTNTKAALGLMLLLSAWLVAAVAGNVVTLTGDDDLRLPILLSGGLIALATAVAGGVLAALGVAEIRANRARYTQGMKQALTALALCACFLALSGAGAFKAIRSGGAAAEVEQIAATTTQPTTGEALRFEKFNFVFDMPAKPWVKTPPGKLAPDACVALLRARPQVAFQLIAEDGAAATGSLDTDALAEVAMANLASVAAEHRVVDKHAHQIAGVDGLRIFSRARIGSNEFTYVHWVAAHGGNLYQLVTSGKPTEEDAVRAAAGEMGRSFRLIDPYKAAPAAPTLAGELKSHRSDRYGYSLRMSGDGWRKSPAAAQLVPMADFAAQHGDDTCMAVIPIALQGIEPSVEALFDAMLHSTTRIEPAQITVRSRIDAFGMPGYTASYWRFMDGARYDYRFLLVKSTRFAYLCAGWTRNRSKMPNVEASVRSMLCDALQPKAIESASMTPLERERHGLIFNELGLLAIQARQCAQAAMLFTRALDLRPDEVIAENLVIAYAEDGRMREALTAAERALARYPLRATLRTRTAFLQAETGNEAAAIVTYAKLFAGGHQDDGAMRHYVTMLAKAKRVDDAIEAAEQYQRRYNSRNVALDHADLLALKGEPERAAALLVERQTPGKFDAEIGLSTATFYLQASRFNDALFTIEKTIAAGGQSAAAYVIRGEAELGLSRLNEAKVSFETALAKAPSDERIKTNLKYVSAMLGEGDNSVVKEVIEPVAIPVSLAAAGADDKAIAKLADGAGGCYLARVTAVSFVKNKDYRTTEHRVIRVLDASGIEMFSTFTFRFDPLTEQIHVNRLEVRDAAGKVVASGRVADYYVSDESAAGGGGSSAAASHKKVLTVPVPGVKPGVTIDFMVTRRDLRPPDALPFTEHAFLAFAPTVRSALFIRGDVGGVRHETSAGVKLSEIDGGLAWTVDDQPAYRYEPMPAPLLRFTPHVVFGAAPAAAAWEAEGRQYLSLIGDWLKPDPAAAALAKRLTDGLTDPSQRVAALVRHVQQDYAYRAIAFGRRARIPQKCGDVIQNRYGDCKDHSLLLQQMLQASGHPAQLALVRSDGGSLVKQLPSLDQFDHVVVYAPSIGANGSFFDCTDKYGNLTAGAPYGLGGTEALLLDPQKPRLVTIPPYSEDGSTIESSRVATVAPDGKVVVKETLTYDGYSAMGLRADLLALSPRDRDEALRKLVADPALDVTVEAARVRELEDRAKPIVVELSYTLGGRFAAGAGGLTGSIPAVMERAYVMTPPSTSAEPRQTPFQIEIPTTFRSTIAVHLPDGYALKAPPRGASADERVTKAQITWKNDGKALRGEWVVRSRAGVYPAADYEPFAQSRKAAIAAMEPTLTLVRSPANSAAPR